MTESKMSEPCVVYDFGAPPMRWILARRYMPMRITVSAETLANLQLRNGQEVDDELLLQIIAIEQASS